MLKKMKKRVLRFRYVYHSKMADYCFERVEKHKGGTFWMNGYVKHVRKLFDIARTALTMEGI